MKLRAPVDGNFAFSHCKCSSTKKGSITPSRLVRALVAPLAAFLNMCTEAGKTLEDNQREDPTNAREVSELESAADTNFEDNRNRCFMTADHISINMCDINIYYHFHGEL